MKIIYILLFITSMNLLANDYVLVSSKSIEKDCLVYIYLNRTNKNLIYKKFTPQNLHEKNNFMKNHIEELKDQKADLNLLEVLGGESKNHIFSYDKRNLIIKYQLKNEETKEFEQFSSILVEGMNCSLD